MLKIVMKYKNYCDRNMKDQFVQFDYNWTFGDDNELTISNISRDIRNKTLEEKEKGNSNFPFCSLSNDSLEEVLKSFGEELDEYFNFSLYNKLEKGINKDSEEVISRHSLTFSIGKGENFTIEYMISFQKTN